MADKYPTLTEAVSDGVCKWLDDPTGPAAPHVLAALRDACTLTTVEALNELPQFSVVRDKVGTIWEKEDHGSPDTPWWQTGDARNRPVSALVLPALLIWMPGWEA